AGVFVPGQQVNLTVLARKRLELRGTQLRTGTNNIGQAVPFEQRYSNPEPERRLVLSRMGLCQLDLHCRTLGPNYLTCSLVAVPVERPELRPRLYTQNTDQVLRLLTDQFNLSGTKIWDVYRVDAHRRPTP